MIFNKFVFSYKSRYVFYRRGIPSGKLSANSINRDIFYVISPAVANTVISASFQNNLQTEGVEKITLMPSEISDLNL